MERKTTTKEKQSRRNKQENMITQTSCKILNLFGSDGQVNVFFQGRPRLAILYYREVIAGWKLQLIFEYLTIEPNTD